MERVKRLRRVALLCCHFVRNYAYYKAVRNGEISKAKNDFWVTIQSNFLDIAVLEWIKLFGDHNDKHHWRKIIQNGDSFKIKMLKHCGLTSDEFCSYRQVIKDYRDSFVAHLDSDEVMNIPRFDKALKLTQYYYKYVLGELKTPDIGIGNLPEDIESYYERCFEESKQYIQDA